MINAATIRGAKKSAVLQVVSVKYSLSLDNDPSKLS